jgi:glycosyltransferase involved in cell wall biosynthesis
VCVGRFCEQKGQDRLVSAWPKVLNRVPSAELYLVGHGEEADGLRRQAGPIDNLHVLGGGDEVPAWLTAANVVVLPSRWEAGLSLVAMEALASGRSVVATEVAGVRDGLSPGCGAVVPQGDEAALVEAMVERLEDERLATAEGAKGRRRVQEHYTTLASAERLADLYAGVLGSTT